MPPLENPDDPKTPAKDLFGRKLTPANLQARAIGFYSPDNRYDELFISNYLDLYVRDAFRRVPGVGNVIIFGERKFAMRLWLDPNKLAGRGLTATDVVNALREQNVQVAAGSVGAEPSAPDQQYQISVRAEGRLAESAQFENVIVKAGKEGALVRVRDIGRVELGAESYSSRLRFGGVQASGIGITPPVGTIMFTTCAITRVPLQDFIKESLPWLAMLLGLAALIAAVPGTATWLGYL